MTVYQSPGLYTRETDFSFYVKQISTSACAMVGVARKGPVNKATLVTSWDQFVRKFGGFMSASYLAYAAKQFFDNGGQVLWVVRIAHYSDVTDAETLTAEFASATVNDRAVSPGPTLKIEALDPGTEGNNLGYTIEAGDSTASFTLKVYEKGKLVEAFRNLTMDEASPNHCEQAVNGRSEFVTVEDLDSEATAPADLPQLVSSPALLSGGVDGLVGLDDNDFIGDSSTRTGIEALNEVSALNLLCIPGACTGPVIHAALGWCERRQTVMLIADSPMGLEPQEVVEFRKGQGDFTGHAAFNSSYGAIYWPWVQVSDPLTGKPKSIPPSGSVAGCYARSDQKAKVWSAPAGTDRGRIFGAVNLDYVASQGERDVLYPEGVNVIASFPDTGINIWGQKTLQSVASALDRVNVRRLMMYVEESVAASGKFAVFEPNLGRTWRMLERLIDPFLRDIKDNEGFYDYRTQCDEETNTPVVQDRNELRCRVFVKPTKTAEFVEINFILVPGSTGKFEEVLG